MLKFKISVLFLFLICLCSFSFVKASENDLTLLGKVIYIDPGHGGKDPGAIYKDIYESNINLEISLKLRDTLEKKGAIVLLTRDGDYDLSINNAVNRKRSDLSRRANVINNSQCDIYLSIHLNSISSSTWSGIQVFYDDANERNEKIAKMFQDYFKKELNTKREYKELTDRYMYKRITRPGILIEVGFLSNPNDRYLLQKKEYQYKFSNIVLHILEDYFN